jgi:membrane protease YdiL (CAAX protease family)
MTTSTTPTTTVETRTRRPGLGTFFAATFALTWGIAAMFVLAPDVAGQAGLTNPLYVLAVWAPAVAGIFVAWRRLGVAGLPGFFARLGMVRMPAAAWGLLLAGIPVLVYLGAALAGTAGDSPTFTPWYTVLPTLAASLFLAGTVEELGWRGVALPLLQRRLSPLMSGLVLGVAWALWHLPAFALSGTVQSAWSFGPYFAGLLALSVIITWFFNVSGGSILVAWLVHFQAMNPLFPDAQPWDSLLYVAAAVVLVVLNRGSMLRRGSGVVGLQRPASGTACEADELR